MSTSDRPSTKSWLALWMVLAVAGCALWLYLLNGADEARVWRALLVNFLFFTPLAAGLVVWPAIVATCQGKWHHPVERLANSAIAFALPSLATLLILWWGSGRWSPWNGINHHQGAWLHPGFLFGRDLAALLIFWVLALYHLRLTRRGEGARSAPLLVLVYCLAFSLIGFDLVMSLDPLWHSNLAGGYFFMSGLYGAMTCWALISARRPEAGPDQLHDMGKLTVAFSLMTTYLMYSHLLPYWYENLPHEIRFLVPRMHMPEWRPFSFLLVGLVYFGPLVLLLPIRTKRSRAALGTVAFLVLCGLWLERWWLVAPIFEPTARLGLAELSLAAGFAGILGLGMLGARKSGGTL